MLDEPGILLRRSGHPTSLYLERKEFPKKIGPWKFRDWAQIALLGPPGTLKGSNTRSKCVFTMNLTQAGQWGAVGTKSGPLGPSEDLGGPQKGLLGSKRALPPVARKGPDIRSKFVLTMNLTQAGQWGADGTKSGPPWSSDSQEFVWFQFSCLLSAFTFHCRL